MALSRRAQSKNLSERDLAAVAKWRELRFGMFIHWGLYAIPAGIWDGKAAPGLGEWIMRNAPVPREEYMALAGQFNPVKFDAEEWVALAKKAGMKYLVITSKHHDGFAIYRSDHPFSMVSTPFERDPLKELADACRKADIRLGFYYSQYQDWTAPGAAGHLDECENWSMSRPPAEDFKGYVESKVKPQLRELLTNYGPIALIWFDTPCNMTAEESLDLRNFVKSIQPDCLVSGRIGNDLGDYGSMGDNMIPVGRIRGDWETPATLNDTWGFRSDDSNWKDADTLIYLLVDLVSKGVNYLLNVGPTAEGEIPPPSVELLEQVGGWMDVNSEAVHATQPSPFDYELPGLRMTVKGDSLYLFLLEQHAGPVQLHGLKNSVRGVVPLADAGQPVDFSQTRQNGIDLLEVSVPGSAPGACVSVLRIDLDGPPQVDEALLQQPGGSISLPAFLAARQDAEELEMQYNGAMQEWRTTRPALQWQYRVGVPGRFRVDVCVHHHACQGAFPEGIRMRVTTGDQEVEAELAPEGTLPSPRARYAPEVICGMGEIQIDRPGSRSLSLQRTTGSDEPIAVTQVRLMPVV